MQQLLARTSTPRGLFARKASPHQRPAFRSAHRVLRPAVVLPPLCSLPSNSKLPPAAPSLVDQKRDQKETGWAVASKKLAKTAAICGLAVALALGTVAPAEAARSGGRAGGSSFSSRSSRSYSSGTSRSMGGGGGYKSYSAPSVTVMPSVVMPLAPVGYGYGYGYSFFPAPSAVFSLFALAIFAFVAVNTFTSISGGSSAAAMDDAYGPEPITVAKVQVGLLGLARTLKDDLDSLAVRADTSGSRGLHMLLQETVLALLRNPDYYVYGGAAADEMRDGDKAERAFNRLSMQERSKFREETLSNVGGVTRRRQLSKKEDGVNELMVVTIVVAAEGRINLPKINNSQDLRAALNTLGGISPTKVVAVELLWTPQAEGDYYTRDEVIADYPDLVPL